MSNETKTVPRPARSLGFKLLIVAGCLMILFALLVYCFFLLLLGVVYPFRVGYHLLAGWYLYLQRAGNSLSSSPTQVVWGVVILVFMSAVLHLLLKRGYRLRFQSENSPAVWQPRWTCTVLALLLLLLGSSFAVTELTRQVWALATSQERISFAFDSQGGWKREQSGDQLAELGLALHSYQDVYGHFPAGGTFDQTGQPQHSWLTYLLPFLGEERLYRQIDLDQPWSADVNRSPFQQPLYYCLNPGLRETYRGGTEGEPTSAGYQPAQYAANSYVMNANAAPGFQEISDGSSNTLLAGEVNAQFKAWGDPTNFRDPTRGINADPHGFGGPFQGGAQFLMVDGSVRFINENIDPAILKALATPNGGEPVGEGSVAP